MNLISFLFKKPNHGSKLVKLQKVEAAYNIKDIEEELDSIEKEIKLTTQEIFKAHIVRLRSLFTKETNIIGGFKRKIVESKATTSAEWHQKKLVFLNQQKVRLVIELDRLTGKTWIRRIKSWIKIISLILTLLFSFLLIIMAILTALYLLPIFAIIILAFLIFKNKKNTF